ncbi:MAG: LuxR family transcriptional regulator, partial [Phaeodactylibacter sp.]|nr:LuxR family transcriptional regulator [Phaeodactylibacter sp.]
MRQLLFYIFLGIVSLLKAQEQPPVIAYEPDVYDAGNQNWMISQGPQQFIYAANNKGVLEYNGMQWTLFPSPNETIIRAVKVVEERIYTGCYQEFGYWSPNSFGGLEYHSLSQAVADKMVEDEHFWNILVHDGQVVFQSLDQLFIYQPDSEAIQVFSPERKVDKLFTVRQDLIYSDDKNWLYRLEGGEPIPVINAPLPSRVIHLWDSAQGIGVVTDRHGIWEIPPQGKALKIPDHPSLANTRVYSALRLENGGLALGTISNGIYIFNGEGDLQYHIIQTDGLTNNTVLSLFEDADQNIWAGTDNGVSCVNLGSPFRKYTDQSGFLGTVYTAIEHNGRLYFGTNQGLFTQLPSQSDFTLIKGTLGQVWSLYQHEDLLFCGHDQGTFIIEGLQASQIFDKSGTWQFSKVPGRSDLLLQGNYYGLSVLQKEENGWRYRNKVEGFNLSSRFVAIHKDKEIYISHEYKGVFGLQLDNDFSKVIDRKDYSSPPKGKNAGLIAFDERVFYYSRAGVFELAGFEQGFIRNETLSKELAGEAFESGKMSVDPEGRLWFFTNDELTYFAKGVLSGDWEMRSVPVQSELVNAMSGYENITWLRPDRYLIGTADGYLIFNFANLPVLDHEVCITHVQSKQLDGVEQILPLDRPPALSHSFNNMSFEFAVPTYSRYFIPEFQYRLLGRYDAWSEWSHSSILAFRNLPFGNYTLEIKSRIGHQESQNTLSYTFFINRPWYWSKVAICSYLILGVFMAYFTHRAYTRYYQRQREELNAENELRLNAQQREAELEIIKVRNEQLQQDSNFFLERASYFFHKKLFYMFAHGQKQISFGPRNNQRGKYDFSGIISEFLSTIILSTIILS